jgi:hypothetical protein
MPYSTCSKCKCVMPFGVCVFCDRGNQPVKEESKMMKILSRVFAFHSLMWYVLIYGAYVKAGWTGVWFVAVGTIFISEFVSFKIELSKEKKNEKE